MNDARTSDNKFLEDHMPKFRKLSRTDISAYLSVALFGMTILISAVGPAEAGSSFITSGAITSPTVSYKA